MNNKNSVIRIITWVLTVFNLCATVYYIVDSRKNHGKFTKMCHRLNRIKDELNDITEELNDLTNELNEEYKKENNGKDKSISPKIDGDISNVADIDDVDTVVENLDDEEVEE